MSFYSNRLIEAILMSTYSIQLSVLNRKSSTIILNSIASAAEGFYG